MGGKICEELGLRWAPEVWFYLAADPDTIDESVQEVIQKIKESEHPKEFDPEDDTTVSYLQHIISMREQTPEEFEKEMEEIDNEDIEKDLRNIYSLPPEYDDHFKKSLEEAIKQA